MPIDLLLQFEAAVPPVTPGKSDAQLCHMTDRHRQACETLQATKDALLSARRDLAHQKKLHEDAAGRPQTRIDDLQVQVTRLVKTLDRKRAADAILGLLIRASSQLRKLCSPLPGSSPLRARGCLMPCGRLGTSSALRTTPALTNTTRRGTHRYQFCSRHGRLPSFPRFAALLRPV